MIHKIHRFAPNETIRAVIRKYHNRILSNEELIVLTEEYNKLNNYSIPRLGVECKIPIIDDAQE